jgi:AmmeMemoRadiSam system protein B
MGIWYPENKIVLEEALKKYLKESNIQPTKLNGVIVPHAGYQFSGAVAGKAISLLKHKRIKKAIVIGPSHYVYLDDAITSNLDYWHTPLGKIKIFNSGFIRADIQQEHSISNQVPFLQKIGIKEIMPLMVGQINIEKAGEIADKIAKIDALYVFSTDLSHFMPFDDAVEKDKETIKAIEDLDTNNFPKLDACGLYPLLILLHLCKIKKTKPHLIEYKNSGHITGDKSSVVGYASFYF